MSGRRLSNAELAERVDIAAIADLAKANKTFRRFLLRFALRAGIFTPNYQTANRTFTDEGRRALGLETLAQVDNALRANGDTGIFAILEQEGAILKAQIEPQKNPEAQTDELYPQDDGDDPGP